MGTFAELFRGGRIPDNKKEEFSRRIEELFQAGGMMEIHWVQMCGKKLITLRKATIHQYGMDFFHNYFEDDNWENAGFDIEDCHVWSNKIGWSYFNRAVVAAYALEELYIDGPAITMVNGEIVTSHSYTGWINYLFYEHFSFKNRDPWKLFESMHEQTTMELERYEWEELVYDAYGAVGYFEIRAVLDGTDAVIEKFKNVIAKEGGQKNDKSITFFDDIIRLKYLLGKYRQESTLDEAEQLSLLLKMFRTHYEQDKLDLDGEYENEELKMILFFTVLSDAPAYAIKSLAETYQKDFWELWDKIRDVAKRRGIYGNVTAEVPPISTTDFFGQKPDDMILFWDDDGEIVFSEGLKKWFADLSNRYDVLMKTEFSVVKPLNWILDLMEYADENYYRVYTMNDFFEETVEHLNDSRYLALWKMYDEMLHDPEMEDAGSVIFVPDGPEYQNIGLHYWGEQPRRRLLKDWSIMSREKKSNRVRVTFRRYMALVANKKLRERVFGF